MAGKRYPNFSGLLLVTALALMASSVQAIENEPKHAVRIEVFTTTDVPVAGEGVKESLFESRKVNLQVFELDGVQRIEARLSKGLSADPDESRRIVLTIVPRSQGL